MMRKRKKETQKRRKWIRKTRSTKTRYEDVETAKLHKQTNKTGESRRKKTNKGKRERGRIRREGNG